MREFQSYTEISSPELLAYVRANHPKLVEYIQSEIDDALCIVAETVCDIENDDDKTEIIFAAAQIAALTDMLLQYTTRLQMLYGKSDPSNFPVKAKDYLDTAFTTGGLLEQPVPEPEAQVFEELYGATRQEYYTRTK